MRLIPTLCLAALVAAPPAGFGPAPRAAAQSLEQRLDAVRQKRTDAQQQAGRARRVEILQALLYRDLTVSFDETPARDAFEFIRTSLGINMVVRYADDAIGTGIEPDLPVTIDADQMQALELLELVLEQVSINEPATWQLRRSFLEVGTKERLGVPAAQELRIYPIDDIIFDPPRFTDAPSLRLDYALNDAWNNVGGWGGGFGSPWGSGWGTSSGGMGGSISVGQAGSGGGTEDSRRQGAEDLMDLITQVIEPDAWTRNGGTAASIHFESGALIVKAPDFIQRQIGGYPRVPRPE